MTKKIRSFKILPEVEDLLFDPIFAGADGNRTAALEYLISQGLKYEMLFNHNKPLSRKFLDSKNPAGVFVLYHQFRSAINRELGIMPDERFHVFGQWRFEKCPPNSKFYDGGENYLLLNDKQIIGPDGNIFGRLDNQ